jgi:CRP/FNR family cyclic AMP-dependent transcriptional regulator
LANSRGARPVVGYGATVTGGFVSGFNDAERAAFRELGSVRRYRRGAYLILEGDRGDNTVVVLEGRVKIVTTNADGRESLMALRGPGELVGELNALAGDDSARSASVCALEDVTVRSIAAADLVRFLEAHPSACFRLLRQLAARLREATSHHADAAGYDTLRRLARALVEEADRKPPVPGGELVVGHGLSQSELAGLVAASPKSVARALASLRARGLITTSRRSILINDLDGLRQFTG